MKKYSTYNTAIGSKIEKAITWEKADKPLHVIFPTKYHQKLRWVAQIHIRGLKKKYTSFDALLKSNETGSIHVDLRYEHTSKKFLLGITLFTPGSLKNINDNKFLKKEKMEGEPKNARIPLSWLTVDNTWFPPNTVGATQNTWGYMKIIDHGYLYLGVSKPVMIELFIHSQKVSGRFVGRSLPLKSGQAWLFFFPKDQTPYVKTKKGLDWYDRTLKDKVPIKWLCGQNLDLQQIISKAILRKCKNLS